jgi:hypothetical protein
VVKLDARGDHVFSRSFGGAGYHHGCGVAAADGGIVVAGSFEGELILDAPITSQGDGDVFVAKLDAAGAVVWSKSFGDAGDQRCSSLAVDPQGNVLVGGRFAGAIDFGGGPLQSQGGGSLDADLFVAKLDEDGQHRFSRRIGAHQADDGPRVGASASGNVIVAGGVGEQVEVLGDVIDGSEEGKLFTVAFDPDGGHLWTDSALGAGDGALSLAVGPDAIFVAGSTLAVSLATWSLDGSLLGAESFLVIEDELSFGTADSLAPGREGGVVIAGSFTPALDFGCGPLEAAEGLDLFVTHLRAPP